MAACPNCGVALEGNPKFCPECGAPITAKEKKPEPEYEDEYEDFMEDDDLDDDDEVVYSKAQEGEIPVPNFQNFDNVPEEDEEEEEAPAPAKPKFFGKKKEEKVEEKVEVKKTVAPTDPDDPTIDPYWDDIIAETEEELVKLPKEMLIKGLGLVVAVFVVIAWLIIIL